MLAMVAATAAPAQADFSVSPRFFLYFDNASQRQSGFEALNSLATEQDAIESARLSDVFGTPVTLTTDNITSASINNQVVYPLFGGAVTMDLNRDKRTQVTLSALYGKSDSQFRTLQNTNQTVTALGFAASDILAMKMEGPVKTKRLDLELTFQHRLNERFALLGGLRYENLRSKGSFDVDFTSSNNGTNLFQLLFGEGDIELGLNESQGRSTVKTNDNIYSARFGGAAFAPIGSRNMVYVNGLIHVTHTADADGKTRFVVPELDFDTSDDIKIKGETTMGPDIAVGYQHRFTDSIGLDVRYRGIFYFPVSGSKSFDDPRVNHGLNVGLTFAL